jgi:hypothetical protein
MEFSWDSPGFGWKRMKNSFIHYQARESGGKSGAHVTRSLQKGRIYFRAKGIVILCAIHVLSSFFAAHRKEEDGTASTSIGAGRSGIQIFSEKMQGMAYSGCMRRLLLCPCSVAENAVRH